MCCRSFWKRTVPFVLAFWLGLFAAGFFSFDEFPLKMLEKKVAPPVFNELESVPVQPARKTRDCIPADPDLKYRPITEKRSDENSGNGGTDSVEPIKPPDKKAKAEEDKLREEIRKYSEDFEKKYPESYSVQQNLIYLEKCLD